MDHRLFLAGMGALWVASEIILSIVRHSRSGESQRHDRLSIMVLWVGITASTFLGAFLRVVPATRMGGGEIPFFTGLALFVAGMAIRYTAIFTLRRYFTVDVSIRSDHRVIQHGIYRIVRHPAYLGSLVSFIGLGVAFSNWLSVAVITLGTLIAFSYRVAVEERALVSALGDEYRSYAARTKRFIPGIF